MTKLYGAFARLKDLVSNIFIVHSRSIFYSNSAFYASIGIACLQVILRRASSIEFFSSAALKIFEDCCVLSERFVDLFPWLMLSL